LLHGFSLYINDDGMAWKASLSWGSAEVTTLSAEKQYRHLFTATVPALRLKINENILFNWIEKDRLFESFVPL
jgi:hypothetical protein